MSSFWDKTGSALAFLISKVNGWKTIVAFILLQVPWFTEHPLIVDAIKKVVEEPSAQNIGELVIHLLLLVGVSHKILKPKA